MGTEIAPPSQNEPENPAPLNIISSDNAAEIDDGIRKIISGVHLSILTMSLGLATIKSKNLYKALGCRKMSQYIKRLCDDYKMVRSSFYYWLNIGEAYIKYKSDLEEAGFIETDGPTKLRYLERALVDNHKQDVFNNLKTRPYGNLLIFQRIKPLKVR